MGTVLLVGVTAIGGHLRKSRVPEKPARYLPQDENTSLTTKDGMPDWVLRVSSIRGRQATDIVVFTNRRRMASPLHGYAPDKTGTACLGVPWARVPFASA